MRPLFLAFLCLWISLGARAETIREWVNAAPKGDIRFAPWGNDISTDVQNGNATLLAQGFYGYLDLSHLPADAFPVKLRIIYDAPASADIADSNAGAVSQLKDTAPVGPGLVIEETTFTAPADATAVPVWNAPLLLRQMGYGNYQESVRAEIESRTGTLLGRLRVGVSQPPWNHPRAILVNTPGANQPFNEASYRSVAEVKYLVPDSYAHLEVDTIWIDATTAADPAALNDLFWQQLLLGGTTIVGHPADIELLAKRLGLAPNQPALLGRLVSADSPEAFINGLKPINDNSAGKLPGSVATANPFAFSIMIGKEMHQQLLHFSEFYLGIFVFLQTTVITVAFLRLRGTRRVWLWLVVPGFALAYAVVGIALAHVFIPARSDTRLDQIEFQREGWPQSLLLSHLVAIKLADMDTVLDLPPGSRPFVSFSNGYYPFNPGATFFFRHDAEITRLTAHPLPATHVIVNVRSLLSSLPPCQLNANGSLTILRDFSGAWFCDGKSWYNLGPLKKGQAIDWKTTRLISPYIFHTGHLVGVPDADDDFPPKLKPLLDIDILKPLIAAKEAIFLGVQTAGDITLDSSTNAGLGSRRVVAYQLHLTGGTP